MRCHLPFRGLLNCRDLGGYPVAGGGSTRWRQVLRSDSPHLLEADELHAFDALGIAGIYDLRRAEELAEFVGPRRHVHLELLSCSLRATDPATLLTTEDGEAWLLADYCGMLDTGARTFAVLFEDLAATDCGLTLFHCWGGKDRTGVTAALLLSLLGVDRETVLDDYELTSVHRGPDSIPDVIELFVETGIARPAAVALMSTPRWTMARALERLDEQHRSVERYLVREGRMDPDTIAALRARLVE